MKLVRLALPALALALTIPVLLIGQNGPPQDRPPQDRPQQGYGQDRPDHDRGGWDAPPQEFRDVQRQGFHDGVEAGRTDFENRRSPNAERRREFRHPPVPPQARDEYREGFRRGYESAFRHFQEDRDHHGDDRDHHGDDHDRN